jgi:hypothetical protein
LLYPFVVLGQQNVCVGSDLRIEVLSNEDIETSSVKCMYHNICKITQRFYVLKSHQDTLLFRLDYPSQFAFLNKFYFQQLKIRMMDDTIKELPFEFVNDGIKIINPKQNSTIEISYFYQPDYLMYGNELTTYTFTPYQNTWHSWYFSVENMQLNRVLFTLPDHLKIFVNQPYVQTHNQIQLLLDDSRKKDISFFLSEKKYYATSNTKIDSNFINLFLFKDVIETGDSSSLSAAYLPANRVTDKLCEQYISMLQADLKQIKQVFNKKVTIDVVDACLDISNEDGEIRWGSGFCITDQHILVIMDTSYWNSHLYLHEIIHLYTGVLPDIQDSSYYFFNESMTEFLAVLFKYTQDKERDSVFVGKLAKFHQLDNNHNSIFDVKVNVGEIGLGGSYGIIYLKTPFVIYSFAKKVGVDVFVRVLSEFYKVIEKTNSVNMDVLKNICKNNGVSDADWLWFINNL